jgi:hypothetical protein
VLIIDVLHVCCLSGGTFCRSYTFSAIEYIIGIDASLIQDATGIEAQKTTGPVGITDQFTVGDPQLPQWLAGVTAHRFPGGGYRSAVCQ